ncbi:lysine 2,3-aminomutase [Thermovibrio guaymasensis]|uniref:Lysine 2,3-aminomutase n=1 Tax=Thermovibrio guaymasensis TaxID=240167 RepID=A0A420W9Y6_9BACT|nr:KamA family radical SAM protein [Thermovibrio guaymasensis]RKQ64104.1 lysine 2,3-aminomutase [Thermovibrio guaymasensis]
MIIKDLDRVKEVIRLSKEEEEAFKEVTKVYPFSSSLYYLKVASRSDAVRKMLLPSLEEVDPEVQKFGQDDPLNEEGDKKTPFLTHRYPDRVLIVTTNQCPVLCRYCMRKRNWKLKPFVIEDREIDRAIEYIKGNPKVRDVLISGGEPLSLPVEKLERLLIGLKRIETVEVVRIGTRLPVVDPEKVLREELLGLIEKAEKVWINTHFNHPDEITPEAKEACRALLKSSAPVNNQTVLLKGVNDSADTLERLFRGLQKIKVRPYYLFHCDPVKGVMHFSTTITKGLEILRELFRRISPLAIPYYAVDGLGGYGKVPLLPKRFKKVGDHYTFESFKGEIFTMADR